MNIGWMDRDVDVFGQPVLIRIAMTSCLRRFVYDCMTDDWKSEQIDRTDQTSTDRTTVLPGE
jgi:hypothetical protein